jgi:hypothetical protein
MQSLILKYEILETIELALSLLLIKELPLVMFRV